MKKTTYHSVQVLLNIEVRNNFYPQQKKNIEVKSQEMLNTQDVEI